MKNFAFVFFVALQIICVSVANAGGRHNGKAKHDPAGAPPSPATSQTKSATPESSSTSATKSNPATNPSPNSQSSSEKQ